MATILLHYIPCRRSLVGLRGLLEELGNHRPQGDSHSCPCEGPVRVHRYPDSRSPVRLSLLHQRINETTMTRR